MTQGRTPGCVAQAGAAIDVWASHWHDDPKPFVWTKTVDEIITKVKRGRGAPSLTSSAAWLKRSYEHQPWRRGMISKV